MSKGDLRQLSKPTMYRSAKGGKGKQADRKRQPQPGPVTVLADLHIEVTRETELDARRFLLALEAAVLERGGSVSVSGPWVKPVEPFKARSKQ